MTTKERIERDFTNRTPSPAGIELIEAMRAQAKHFANHIIDNTPESREQSLALTYVEQALFFANSAIARYDSNDSLPQQPTVEPQVQVQAPPVAGEVMGADIRPLITPLQ